MEQLSYVKHLGLIIDCTLNWNKHTHELGKKISRGIDILFKVGHFVTNDTLYSSSGLIVWGNTYATTLNPVVVLQKKAVQIIMTKWRRRTVGP